MSTRIVRSPNSPSRSLEKCYGDAMKLFDAFPNASFTDQQMASVLDRSTNSGGFKSLLSDLRQYGLIDKGPSGEHVVSQALKDMTLINQPEEENALRYSFATHPSKFAEILAEQGNHLPDPDTLENVLVAKFNFNRSKAAKTARALRESLEWAHAIDSKGNVLPPKISSEECLPSEATNSVLEQNTLEPTDKNEAVQNDKDDLSADVPLGNGRVVRVGYPQDITTAEAEKVASVLKALAI